MSTRWNATVAETRRAYSNPDLCLYALRPRVADLFVENWKKQRAMKSRGDDEQSTGPTDH